MQDSILTLEVNRSGPSDGSTGASVSSHSIEMSNLSCMKIQLLVLKHVINSQIKVLVLLSDGPLNSLQYFMVLTSYTSAF